MQQVGGQDITEYLIPAEDLDDLNDKIVGLIELAAEESFGSGWQWRSDCRVPTS